MLRFALAMTAFAALLAVPSQAGTSGCPRCTLTGQDFSNQCLQYSNYEGADFSGAKLVLACLSHANLKQTSFRAANLSGANLTDATVVDADFAGAVFSATQARGTDFSRAKNLTQAQLNGVCGDAKTRAPAGLTIPRCD